MNLSAIVFDLGGVCVGSPVFAIRDYERQLGLPPRFIGVSVASAGDTGPFQRFERGELDYEQFIPLFQAYLTSPDRVAMYQRWRTRRRQRHQQQAHSSLTRTDDQDIDWDTARGLIARIDARKLFAKMVARSAQVDPAMVRAIQVLKASGRYKLGCITNDFPLPPAHHLSPAGAASRSDLHRLMSLFDVVVSSSTEGIRKPDPRIFKIACQRLRVTHPGQVLFLDDLKENVLGARKFGMQTIWVKDVRHAVDELARLVDMQLAEDESDAKTQSARLAAKL